MPLLGREKVNKLIEKGLENVNRDLRGVYFAGLANVISLTPADTGRARNNWFLSVGVPSGASTSGKSKGGINSVRQISKMPKDVLGKKIYFTNNLPYAAMLEYGGYPKAPVNGSYIKSTGKYKILSINGFSKQAPSGMVRISLKKMQAKIRSL